MRASLEFNLPQDLAKYEAAVAAAKKPHVARNIQRIRKGLVNFKTWLDNQIEPQHVPPEIKQKLLEVRAKLQALIQQNAKDD